MRTVERIKRRYKVVVPVEIEIEDEYFAGAERCAKAISDSLKELSYKWTPFGYRLSARPLVNEVSGIKQSWPTMEMATAAEYVRGAMGGGDEP